MSEEPDKKPIRDLLQDITNSRDASPPPRGLISPKLVDRITSFASLFSLLLITWLFLAMIWDVTDPALAFRFIGSTVVILLALLVFRAIDVQFD